MAAPVKKRRKKKAKQSPSPEPSKPPPVIQADFTLTPDELTSVSLNWDSESVPGSLWRVPTPIRGGANVYRVTARGRRKGEERVQFCNVEDGAVHECNLAFFDLNRGQRYVPLKEAWATALTREQVFCQGWARALVINTFGKRWAKAKRIAKRQQQVANHRKAKRHGKKAQAQRKVRGQGKKGKQKSKARKVRHQR